MKSYFYAGLLLLMLAGRASAQTAKLNYDLYWNGRSSYVEVKLTYSSTSTDSTVFVFGQPGSYGQRGLLSLVEHLRSGSGDHFKIDSATSKVTVRHQGRELHFLTYRINGSVNADNGEKAISMELFRPVISPGNLYLMPHVFMMNPEHHPAKEIGIRFHTQDAATPVFFSWSTKFKPGEISFIPADKSTNFLIAAGKNLNIENIGVNGAPYYSITTKGDTGNDIKAALSPYFTRYFPSIRNYWKDKNDPGYFIYLARLQSAHMPFGGGVNIGAGFVMKYFGKFDTWDKEIIAHETSHTWIGSKLLIDQSKADHQWFAEGFNDYVCLANLYNSGIFPQDTLVKFFNERIFKLHYTSKIRSAPNDSIPPNFWKDPAYRKLPYRRGALYAFYLDNQIQLATKGSKSLRDMLLLLFKKAQPGSASGKTNLLSLEDFYAAAAVYLPEVNVREQVERYMINGEPIDFRVVKLHPLFNVSFSNDVPVLSLSNQYKLRDFYKW